MDTLLVILLTVPAMCQRELRLLNMFPKDSVAVPGGMNWIPVYEMAVQDVNDHPNILQGYNITLRNKDSQCKASMALDGMFSSIYTERPYVMFLGPLCSRGAEATAQVSHLWNVTQFSIGAASPAFSDRNRFPHFFRMASPDYKYNQARIGIMKKFHWKKIATINQANELFSLVAEMFIQDVQANNITIISQEMFTHDPSLRVQHLKDRDARIIFAAMYEDRAKVVLCEAYKIGLYGPKIVWLLAGWYSDGFLKNTGGDVECTEDELAKVVEGAFMLTQLLFNPTEEKGVANMTVSEFEDRLKRNPQYNPNTKNSNYVGFVYDSIWLTALALNCSITKLREMGHPKTLDMFDYNDGDINDIIYNCLGGITMVGVTGRTSFQNGDPDVTVQVQRIEGGERKLIAYYRQDVKPHYYEWIDGALQWKDGKIPRDSTFITYRETLLPLSLYITMCASATIGILLAASFFMFNIIYRQNKTVKLSSPNINNILLLGCVICYIPIFIKSTETDNPTTCKIRVFCLSLGFTITFGSLFSKTWRVYKIFTNKRFLRVSIKDKQLLAIICVLVLVVMCVVVVWEIVEPHVIVVKYLEQEIYVIGNDEEVRPFVRMCHSKTSMYFEWTIYIIEGALLAFGAFLAWETRNVKIEALNDSQQIGMCLYNVEILSAVGLTLSVLLDEQVVILYGVTSGCLIIGTTITQCLVFIPKIHAVLSKVEQPGISATIATSAGSCSQPLEEKHLPVGHKSDVNEGQSQNALHR